MEVGRGEGVVRMADWVRRGRRTDIDSFTGTWAPDELSVRGLVLAER